MKPGFQVPAALARLQWSRASHPAGFGLWFADISPQRASSLARRFRPPVEGMVFRPRLAKLPGPGCEVLLLGLGDRATRFWIVNRTGRYSVEVR